MKKSAEEKRALKEGTEMIEHLGDVAFAEIELWPGYRMIDAIGDAIKELQGNCDHKWTAVPAGRTCFNCHLHIRDPFYEEDKTSQESS